MEIMSSLISAVTLFSSHSILFFTSVTTFKSESPPVYTLQMSVKDLDFLSHSCLHLPLWLSASTRNRKTHSVSTVTVSNMTCDVLHSARFAATGVKRFILSESMVTPVAPCI